MSASHNRRSYASNAARNAGQNVLMIMVSVAVVVGVLLFLTRDVFSQLIFLSQSENPVRNVAIFAALWLLAIASLKAVLTARLTAVHVFWNLFLTLVVLAHLSLLLILADNLTLFDIRRMWIERGEAGAALLFYWSELLLPLLIAVAFSLSLFRIRAWLLSRYSPSSSCVAAGFPVFVTGVLAAMVAMKGPTAAQGMAGVYILPGLLSVILFEQIADERPERRPVTVAAGNPLIRNVIVVMDESVSGDFFGQDTDYSLVPSLKAHADAVINYGVATSAHNCSSYSNAVLRWGVVPGAFEQALQLPTIWQYSQASGYTSTYIDAQKPPGTLANFMNIDELSFINQVKQLNVEQIERHQAFMRIDFDIVDHLVSLVADDKPDFIYINKLGVHFPYEGKYPASSTRFQPAMALFEPIGHSDRQALINSYKNAIAWNVNGFFDRLLNSIDLDNTVVIYTSDHGQDLLEEGKGLLTHCNRNSGSAYQGMVPMMVLTRHPQLRQRFESSLAENRHQLSHFNVFPTVLEILGYEHDFVKQHYGDAMFYPVERIGKFYTSELFLPEHAQHDYEWKSVPLPTPSRLLSGALVSQHAD
ncbi:sulfatase-like hydrolase/transferase [Photobacterium halotolerans]|uniref:sulfatase-like hydrolase/transferase n=1 Tax=Photobacterium halotolerans TaxID=265726 RepID=UPI0013732E59|nr:sulfatase-like hydrolase/transferase [Photobacterium halotolerans]NAW85552.1 sulfatase-like hydrolase/transferase [Photobacterium halotolerans]